MATTREDSGATDDSEVFEVPSLAASTDTDQDSDSEEGGFIYPSAADDSDEDFVYPATSENATITNDQSLPTPPPEQATLATESTTHLEQPPVHPVQNQARPSPAQLEALCAAASSGDLVLLKKLFSTARLHRSPLRC
ncbi:hypothetical protein EDD16DRAFT_1582259 [Pisolithus croceorrhizus]|nr:hypothetical protein EDD16DRAFT_1582259 [Pisolithus croceorrhizus]